MISMYAIIRKMYRRGGIYRKVSLAYVLYKEKSVFKSKTLRKLYWDEKRISAGIGSYGWNNEGFDGPAEIGNYVSIGPGVRRLCVNHDISGVSTHPCYFNPIYGWVKNDYRERTKIEIGHDVWIGANAIILPSVKRIGIGAVIAAGAVVTKDIPDFEVWGGVPAHFIKKRFSDEICEQLKESQWWDMPEDDLKKIVDDFKCPEKFMVNINKIGLDSHG